MKLPLTYGSWYTTLSGGQTLYLAPNRVASSSTTETNVQIIAPCSGTLENLFIDCDNPGSGNTITVTARINEADSALTCTITNGNTSASDNSNAPSISAGDRICFKIVTSASLGAGYYLFKLCMNLVSSDSVSGITGYYSGMTGTTNNVYIAPSGGYTDSTEENAICIIPTAGTIKNLRVYHNTAPGSGNSSIYTLRKNGSNTSLTTTVSDTSQNNVDSVNSVAVSAGDRISILYTKSNTPASSIIKVALEWNPDTSGEAIVLGTWNYTGNSNDLPSTTAQSWTSAGGRATRFQTSESWATYSYFSANTTLKKLYVRVGVAPGSTKSWTFELNNGYGTGSGIIATISDTNTDGNDTTHTSAVTGPEIIELDVTPSGTPSGTSSVKWGYVVYNAPTSSSSSSSSRSSSSSSRSSSSRSSSSSSSSSRSSSSSSSSFSSSSSSRSSSSSCRSSSSSSSSSSISIASSSSSSSRSSSSSSSRSSSSSSSSCRSSSSSSSSNQYPNTIIIDASDGDTFDITITGNKTLGVPLNPTDGQKVTFRIYSSGGSYSITLTTSAGGFRFGADITGLTAISNGKRDYIIAHYNELDDFWDVLGYRKGY
jgi:hypothetical protein